MILYRIEDKDGFGYKESLDTNIQNWTKEGVMGKFFFKGTDELYFQHRPMPENDSMDINLITSNHLFAFTNLKQLNNWFLPADLVMGAFFGGKIVIYEVLEENIVFGKSQVAFDSTKAKIIDKKTMDYYLSKEDKISTYDFKEELLDAIECDFEIPTELNTLKENLL